eukprot:CAMPEP_0177283718 /NCGR_PEP_ID=MMETSP0367-20130122/72139_1 /TAXON_ID=447022 ORGANISM="Scrippsiella hangoei-like, Strain SHHI-4" /NCGR_SAMPLE_ID=MMETSP0367 /ASSEMBLY_ACC=CAM_ASM_000362 /LENGTH=148 /DNA_ID=CAMNT_0018740717 /DNA_START=204 /DNA_END=647 /DNA_ORIENTATION=-
MVVWWTTSAPQQPAALAKPDELPTLPLTCWTQAVGRTAHALASALVMEVLREGAFGIKQPAVQDPLEAQSAPRLAISEQDVPIFGQADISAAQQRTLAVKNQMAWAPHAINHLNALNLQGAQPRAHIQNQSRAIIDQDPRTIEVATRS